MTVLCRSAIDRLNAQHEAEVRELRRAVAAGPSQERLDELEEKLAEKEAELRRKRAELDEARKEADYANSKLVSDLFIG